MGQGITSFLPTSMLLRSILSLSMELSRPSRTFLSGFCIMSTHCLRITASEPSPRFQHMSKCSCIPVCIYWISCQKYNQYFFLHVVLLASFLDSTCNNQIVSICPLFTAFYSFVALTTELIFNFLSKYYILCIREPNSMYYLSILAVCSQKYCSGVRKGTQLQQQQTAQWKPPYLHRRCIVREAYIQRGKDSVYQKSCIKRV